MTKRHFFHRGMLVTMSLISMQCWLLWRKISMRILRRTYLHKAMEKMNIPVYFCDWIKTVYHSNESRIFNRGQLSSPFILQKGLFQGNALSPLLFLLCIEPLAEFVRNCDQISGVTWKDKCKKIALCADDVIIAIKAYERSFTFLDSTLSKFASVSGLNINRQKSVVIPIGSTKSSPKVASLYTSIF